VLNELSYACRQLRRTPGFTAIAVLTLALGIGATTTFFALIDAMLWRPARALDLRDTYEVYVQRPPRPRVPGQPYEFNYRILTPAQLEYLKSLPELGVQAVAALNTRGVVVQTATDAGRLTLDITFGNYAAVNHLRPLLGQLAGLDGSAAGLQVVISERIWRSWFRADPNVAGQATIRISRHLFTVAGVLPLAQSHRGTDLWVAADGWRVVESGFTNRFGASFVRFRPGAEPMRLRPMLDHALASGPTPFPEEFKTHLMSAQPRFAVVASTMTWTFLGLSLVVLLAACANLANMLHARAAQRSGEIAIRMSLGAAAGHVYRLFLLEACTIAGLAAICGAAFAWLGLRYITSALPGANLDRFTRLPIDISPDWRMFLYAVAAGAFSAMLVGGLTAWRGSRTPPLRTLAGSGIAESTRAGGRWLRTGLVAVQVSAAVILLLGTSLYLIKGFERAPTEVTFATDHLATAQLEFDAERFNPADVATLLQQILTSVERLSGIEGAAIADGMFGGSYSAAREMRNLVAEDEFLSDKVSRSRLATGVQAAVSPGFLDVLGVKLVRGRNLQAIDVDGAPEVTLISETAARKLWPGEDPLGKRVKLAGDRRWFTVVGTFEDLMRSRANGSAGVAALSSWLQYKGREWLVVLRSSAPGVAAQQIRPAVDAVNQDVPVFNATVADRSIFNATNSGRAFMSLVGSLGLVSLAIAALGVYGVISYTVSRRTREFGIRLALGATPRQILRAVIDDAVHLVLVGLLPGVLLASWSTRALEAQILGLMPNEISTWAIVPILILVIGIFAAWIPARRASRVNPIVALKDL
jgi:putative ABC transport system permease protein